MNYAKVLDAALTLFPKKINVTCIDGVTGNKIGKYKIGLQLLPPVFNKPVSLTIDGHQWRVIKADPLSADDFSIFKKLTLHVLGNDQLHQASLGYNTPTRHASDPATTPNPFYEQFTLDIASDDWLQLEFLPATALPLIQEEVTVMEPLLAAERGSNPLLGYKNLYVRRQTAHLGVNIPFDAFCADLPGLKKGNIRLNGDGYIENGFALQTDNCVYYGTVENNVVTHLCLPAFDCIDDEFSKVITTWDLVFVDWVQGSVTAV